ncbi:uncharacterized protein LOC134230727 [Saccostrea cucullata]|uniref:uncharacterized protein LOC134230727 n=1 Tax=Saccostrea cuccullata TaxID=36930 RepID=UPI002ED6BC7A
MASSPLTTDDKNYIYLNIATLDEIPRIFRILLESQIQPHNLPAAVKTCSTFKLGKEQSDKVIPTPPNVPNYETFDVTLLYTLLRNLCPAFKPTKGWGFEPTNIDLCLGDDIERLRILRNSVVHIEKPCVPNSDFKMQWTLLEDICKRMEKNIPTCLKICGLSEVWYGTDAVMDIASECESNDINWKKKVGAIVHEINITTEKYQGSSNKKLIIRRVTHEDEGEYQAIMQKSRHIFVQSNQIDLKVLGNVHIPKYKGSFLKDQSSKLVINDANFEDESIYCLAVRNLVGEGRSNPFVLRVTGSTPMVTIDHKTDLKARSLTIISNITTTENSPPVDSIHWSKNGSVIPVLEIPEKYQLLKDDKRSLCILNISELDAGSYKCVVKNLVGSSESEIVQLGRPVISIEEETEGKLTNTFRVKVVSIPSVFSVTWAKLVTTDPESGYIPIDLSDPIYSGTSCSTPFPKLVVNKSEAAKHQIFKIFAENFIGQSEAIVGGQESISTQQELVLKKQGLQCAMGLQSPMVYARPRWFDTANPDGAENNLPL